MKRLATPAATARTPRRRHPGPAWCLGLMLGALPFADTTPGQATDWTLGMGVGWRSARVVRDPEARTWNANDDAFVKPRLHISREGNDARMTLAASQEAFLRRTAASQPRLALPRLGAGDAELRYVQTGPLGAARVYGRYARSISPLDAAVPVASVPGGYATWTTGARVALGPAEGGYRFDGWCYQDPRLVDAHEQAWDASLLPVRGAASAALVGWRHRMVGSSQTTLRSDVAVVGVRRALTPSLAGQIEAGVGRATLGANPARQGPAFALSLTGPGADLGPVQASCTVRPGLPVEVTAAAERTLGDARWSLRWESRLDAEGGWRRPPSLVRRLALGVEDTLGRANVVGGEVSAARLWSMFPPALRTDALRFSSWLVRRVRPWLSLRMDYAQVSEASVQGSGLGTPDRYRLGVSLAMVR